ncbi:MAG TPA: hypothetical protein DCY48_02965 [Candidatus Magasanikbacteria bacterium]|nr:hypothetical protein [Candidatus Woesearchaeota archaeon]HAZ28711.1 hypothetical protein [Candidatus Magasanikbacteria bacterium]
MLNGLNLPFKRNNILQVRLTTPELEDIKSRAKERGFESISEFFRYVVINSINIENKVIETNNNVKEILKIIKK